MSDHRIEKVGVGRAATQPGSQGSTPRPPTAPSPVGADPSRFTPLYDAANEADTTIGDLQSALHDVLNLIDYMRCGDGSLPLSGPSKLANANALLRGGKTDALRTALKLARGEPA